MIQTVSQDVFEKFQTLLLIHFFYVSLYRLLIAPVTACQGEAIRGAKPRKKPLKEALDRLNCPGPPVILNARNLGSIPAMEKAQEDRSPKKSATNGFLLFYRAQVPRGSPLAEREAPALVCLQHLQGGFRSGIALRQQLTPLLPD